MRRVIVTGGPSPMNIRIVDSETEATAFAEFDGFHAEVLEPGERPTSCEGKR